jgi:hypothetical protein
MCDQTSWEGVNFGTFFVFAGMRMRTVIRARKLKVEPQELNCATRFVGMLLIPAWIIIMRVVRRNVCQVVGV